MRRWFWFSAALMVVLVGWAVWALRIEEIRVSGLRTLSARTVVEASGLHGGDRILWIRLSAAAARLERLPAIASVTVERSLPRTVVLRIREREALVALDGRPGLVADASGHVFGADPTGLPVFRGWRGAAKTSMVLDGVSQSVLGAFARFPPALRERAALLAVGPSLTLSLGDGTEVRFGRPLDLERKARAAFAVLEAEKGTPLEYIDVRAPSVPVSRRRSPPSPTPAPPSAAPASPSP